MFTITEIIEHLSLKFVLQIFGSKLILWFFGDFLEGFFMSGEMFPLVTGIGQSLPPSRLFSNGLACHVGNPRSRLKELVNIIYLGGYGARCHCVSCQQYHPCFPVSTKAALETGSFFSRAEGQAG